MVHLSNSDHLFLLWTGIIWLMRLALRWSEKELGTCTHAQRDFAQDMNKITVIIAVICNVIAALIIY